MILSIVSGLVGGLGLFLYGMKTMGTGMQKAAGDKLRKILELLTSNPFMATLTGILVTVIVQSSSTTHVMVVGFTNSGLMGLSQALGTMLGANIGTTITAQLISFDIFVIVYPLIGVSAVLFMFAPKKIHKAVGQALLGLGILFLGLRIMSDAMNPLRSYPPFMEILATFGQTPLLGVLVGAAFTAIIQSSSATTGVVIAMTMQGTIDTPSAIAIVLGANIGTSITAALASIGTNLTAKRAVVAIICVKVTGVIVALLLFRPFVSLIYHTGSTVTRQVANAHTIFNVLNVVLFYPIMTPFLRLVTKILPGETNVVETGTKFLNKRLMESPSVAIEAAKAETLRMAQVARAALKDALTIFIHNDKNLIETALQKEDLVDQLEKDIVVYLNEIAQGPLSQDQTEAISDLMHICGDLERIGDHAMNIIQMADIKMENKLLFSEDAIKELEDFYAKVDEMIGGATVAFETNNDLLARQVIEGDDVVDAAERHIRKNHIKRLNKKKCTPYSGVLYLDVISNLERVADHATNLAEVVTGEF